MACSDVVAAAFTVDKISSWAILNGKKTRFTVNFPLNNGWFALESSKAYTKINDEVEIRRRIPKLPSSVRLKSGVFGCVEIQELEKGGKTSDEHIYFVKNYLPFVASPHLTQYSGKRGAFDLGNNDQQEIRTLARSAEILGWKRTNYHHAHEELKNSCEIAKTKSKKRGFEPSTSKTKSKIDSVASTASKKIDRQKVHLPAAASTC